jgi:hypothetical protein
MGIEIEELERFNQIKERMARRGCHCGHCEDLRWLIGLLDRVARRELVWAATEAEARALRMEKEKADA